MALLCEMLTNMPGTYATTLFRCFEVLVDDNDLHKGRRLSRLLFFLQLFVVLTEMSDLAFVAFWFASQTDVATVKYQPMMGFVYKLFWNVPNQLLFYFERGLCRLCD
jgi:hypothetical protein